ncbi:SMP-30/gluconolactonase/LRE family protein [Sphingomonas canadensis]|uniref:SMP-30/gluconolactonase/LRE family protein n=1 Tax=Sphingomonas canadensis TaxID=1219257 RepID=A0ABW3HA67_9SPHN|nr:hypothetical protein [Sphingomonas canadensis]MCW3836808.1 hypothetical protein [Sphingomonas canadensis]
MRGLARTILVAALPAALMLAGGAAAQEAAPASSSAALRRGLADAIARQDKSRVTADMLRLARMGATLSDAGFDGVAPMLDPAGLAVEPRLASQEPAARIEGLRGWFRANAALPGAAPVATAAEVPAGYRLVEGIAWDPAKQRLFAATVAEGRVALLEGGQWRELALGNPRGSLFGMAIDAPRRLLWIATGVVEQTGVAGERMAGLIALDLDRLEVVRRVPLPPGAKGAAGDLAVAPDGTVYASDMVAGAIHRCVPGCAAMEELLPAGSFKSPQGIVVRQGGAQLIVADYSTGLHAIDPAARTATPLRLPRDMMLEGIDGLVAVPGGRALIAIQNGTRPRRILRIVLDGAGQAVEALEPLHIPLPGAGEPTLGLVRDGALWFVGDSQWERYGPGGTITDGTAPRATPLLVLPLAKRP